MNILFKCFISIMMKLGCLFSIICVSTMCSWITATLFCLCYQNGWLPPTVFGSSVTIDHNIFGVIFTFFFVSFAAGFIFVELIKKDKKMTMQS